MNFIEEINDLKIVIRRTTDNKVAKIDLKYGYEGMSVGDEVEIERTSEGGILLSRVDKTLFFDESRTESILKQDPSVRDIEVKKPDEPVRVEPDSELPVSNLVDLKTSSNVQDSKVNQASQNWSAYFLVFLGVFAITLFAFPRIERMFSDEQKAYDLFLNYMKSEYDASDLADFKLNKNDVLIIDQRKSPEHFDSDFYVFYYSSRYESAYACEIYLSKPVDEQCK